MDDLISREATLDAFADYVAHGMSMNDYDALEDIVIHMPSVSVAEKVGYKDLWNKLYRYLNDMCLGIAPDETTSTDERADRMAQLDILDDILKWMNTEEVERMREVRE